MTHAEDSRDGWDDAIEQFGEPKLRGERRRSRSGTRTRRSRSSRLDGGRRRLAPGWTTSPSRTTGQSTRTRSRSGSGTWRRLRESPATSSKKAPSKLIKVPDGVVVECVTIDGGEQKPLEIESPDFVCIGGTNEVYPLARSRFNDEFEWID